MHADHSKCFGVTAIEAYGKSSLRSSHAEEKRERAAAGISGWLQRRDGGPQRPPPSLSELSSICYGTRPKGPPICSAAAAYRRRSEEVQKRIPGLPLHADHGGPLRRMSWTKLTEINQKLNLKSRARLCSSGEHTADLPDFSDLSLHPNERPRKRPV